MSGGQAENAIARIEAALVRIEQASARLVSERHELGARHVRLKQAVSRSLAEMDRLIAEAQP